jgi:uncharacterized phage protein (TIGR01671 family)
MFRGKRKDNGKWEYGDFGSPCNIINESYQYDSALDKYAIVCNDNAIDMETLGQFTGLFDVNGMKIYDGDIVNGMNSITIWFVKLGLFVTTKTKLNTKREVNSKIEIKYEIMFTSMIFLIWCVTARRKLSVIFTTTPKG